MPETLIPQALEAWREGERLLEELPPLSPDHESVALAISQLSETIQSLSEVKTLTNAQLRRSRSVIEEARGAILAASQRGHARPGGTASESRGPASHGQRGVSMTTFEEGRRFEIHVFPSGDDVLQERVLEIVAGHSSIDAAVAALEAGLRPVHPALAVRLRSPLAELGRPVVYVFRDGTAQEAAADDAWLTDEATAWLVTDAAGTYIDANEAAAQLFGVDRGSIVGCVAGHFTRPDARVQSASKLWASLARSGRLHSTAVLERNGVRVEFVTIRDGDGPGRNVTYLRAK